MSSTLDLRMISPNNSNGSSYKRSSASAKVWLKATLLIFIVLVLLPVLPYEKPISLVFAWILVTQSTLHSYLSLAEKLSHFIYLLLITVAYLGAAALLGGVFSFFWKKRKNR